jgi:hypothetical protein
MVMVEKYKILENFLTKDETNIYKRYCVIQHRIGAPRPHDSQVPFAMSTYGDPAMEALMLNKKEKLEKIINLKLLPTYAFWRMYVWDNDLKIHRDRPSCEISLTVHFGSDNTHEWPIYMGDNAVNLKPGDAVVYKGCEIEHKRDNFKGDWYAQAFLHYVNAEGPHREHFMDKRQIWGIPK